MNGQFRLLLRHLERHALVVGAVSIELVRPEQLHLPSYVVDFTYPVRHFVGLSRRATIIVPRVARSFFGSTTGFAAASTARTASRYAPEGSGLRPVLRFHAWTR